MGNITKVPNGPLIKKKGKFKGSTLKNGGPVQKERRIIAADKTAVKKVDANKIMKNDKEISAREYSNKRKIADYNRGMGVKAVVTSKEKNLDYLFKDIAKQDSISKSAGKEAEKIKKTYRTEIKKKAKAGAMIKRADGSMSRRGLWDNIRANKGSGKKPTAAMLKQEKKIKAKAKK